MDLIVVPALSEISRDRVSMRPVAGLPLVHLEKPRSRDALRLSKRVFDVVASTVVLVLIAPVLAAVALAVKLGDGGPVLFRQVRAGRDGEPFHILKFRSMVTGADSRRPSPEAAARDRGNAVMFKLAVDPRVTRVGRFLRRYSLDELPQLWNVLRGDMSLVGPRPALPREVTEYDQDARRRLAVRPGITGLWQVSGRSDLSWSETVRLDLYYVDNWSFTQDLQILVRTVRAVMDARGAY
ncbi:UDP-phosphate galactose phosphotransferase [Brachybacterium muris UCD-AY4]|uniref:UDP-phosphate galactose phosphotransferase n=1 Tax=Brachybacterium muris UCD-AY4 TaxID=1249481 RepID=A0A022KVQ4_9MICO|nr:UDP-phosphate galactose phosphotransferase [Brachybacterium muris UCD-AY4]